ncbi:MAG: Fic family protein [Prevotellaceae bacterium]|jgi:Fic family protein|nr:Fic family protein [Prevotellaceae bacterium]
MIHLISTYNNLLEEYNKQVVSKFNEDDFKLYNEILFSAHSCGIEGNSFSVDDTRELKEQQLGNIPVGKTLFEAYEMLDHFRAYEFLFANVDKPLTENLLKETHRILMEHTLGYRIKGAVPGEYTDTDMAAGETVFGDHKVLIAQVPKLFAQTQKMLDDNALHPVILSARFHCFFEYLHPFRDGNGRIGRLFANFILAKQQHPIIIIEREKKAAYLTALKSYKKENTTEFIEEFFLHTAISRMEREIEEKKNLTKNFLNGFSKEKTESL